MDECPPLDPRRYWASTWPAARSPASSPTPLAECWPRPARPSSCPARDQDGSKPNRTLGRQHLTAVPGTAQPGENSAAESGPSRVRRLALDIATALRSVTKLAPVSQLQGRGTGHAPPGLLVVLADLVDQPVHVADAPDPAARAAALLGARAAGLRNEETLRARFAPSTSPTEQPHVPRGQRC
jgi:sugar (pentulose or hexulose) kinase